MNAPHLNLFYFFFRKNICTNQNVKRHTIVKHVWCCFLQSSAACESTYANFPRGHDCYCSPFDGCFHSHFQVIPQVVWDGTDGIHHNRDNGVHEGDYFIEIIATNKARLQSKKTTKVKNTILFWVSYDLVPFFVPSPSSVLFI